MTPAESRVRLFHRSLYESLETVIEKHGLAGLEVIVDALVTIAAAEAEEDPDEWTDIADELLVLYDNLLD